MLKIGEFSRLAQVSPKTLRLYDERGLLKPAWIDRFSGYRYYTLEQLARLNRILALKDLGFSLDQIGEMQRDDLPAAELRGMIRLKRAELEQHIQHEQARLARIETRLQQIEQEASQPAYEVVLKSVPPMRVAGIRDMVPSFGEMTPLINELQAYLTAQGVSPQANVPTLGIYYDAVFRERGMDMEVATQINTAVKASQRVQLHELPGVETMACVLHRGDYTHLREAYSALLSWVDASGYQMDGPNRDIFLQFPSIKDEAASGITEVQFPVRPKPFLSAVQSYKEQKLMEIKIVTKPAFTVVGMPYFGKNENSEIPQVWDQMLPHAGEIQNKVEPHLCYGVCGEMEADGRFHYLAGYEVDGEGELPKDMESWQVPQQTYAVFPSTLQTIHETYQYAHQTWMPHTEYERDEGPDFEFYDVDFDPNKGTGLYIYIPVKKKSS